MEEGVVACVEREAVRGWFDGICGVAVEQVAIEMAVSADCAEDELWLRAVRGSIIGRVAPGPGEPFILMLRIVELGVGRFMMIPRRRWRRGLSMRGSVIVRSSMGLA